MENENKIRPNKIRPNKNIVVYLLGNQLHFGSSCKRDYWVTTPTDRDK